MGRSLPAGAVDYSRLDLLNKPPWRPSDTATICGCGTRFTLVQTTTFDRGPQQTLYYWCKACDAPPSV